MIPARDRLGGGLPYLFRYFDFLEAGLSYWRSFLGLVTPVDLLWSRRKRIQEGRSPAERWADVWRVWVGNFSVR